MDPLAFPISRPFGLVGFDAADVMRDALLQLVDEGVGLRPDLTSGRRWSPSGAATHFIREKRRQIFAEKGREKENHLGTYFLRESINLLARS